MRILLVLGPAEVAGIQRHVTAFLPALVQRHNVTVAFLLAEGPAAGQMRDVGARVHVLAGRNGHDIRMGLAFARLLQETVPDVVHFHEAHLAPLLACFALGFRKIVATEHCSLAHARAPWRSRVLYGLLGAMGARITAVSAATLEAVAEIGGFRGVRERVVWNCVDIRRLQATECGPIRRKYGLPDTAEIVGAVGRLAVQKGWDLFLDTCREIGRQRPEALFVIAGAGPEEKRLKAMIARSGMADRIRFLGFQANGAEVVSTLDVFILTSLHEELPTTLLEALATQTPVAGVVPEGGVREVLALQGAAEACRLRLERNAAMIAGDVIELLDNSELRRRQVRAGRGLVEEYFSGEATAAAYEAVYTLGGQGDER